MTCGEAVDSSEFTKEQRAFLKETIGEHPEIRDMDLDDGYHWVITKLQDEIDRADERLTAIFRENGYVALSDATLFLEVWERRPKDATLSELFTYLRLKKKRGYKQQQALEIWERYYARLPNGAYSFADDETAERLHQIWNSREEAREAKKGKATK